MRRGVPVREDAYSESSAFEVGWPGPFLAAFIPLVLPPGTHSPLGEQCASIQPKPLVGLEQKTLSPGKPGASSMFQGWQKRLREIVWHKILGLFHTSCYQNQVDNMCAGKIELSIVMQRPRLSSTRISGNLFLATEIKQ